jgi:hypothetical protein
MLPMIIPQQSRAVRTFEVTTPAGRVYQFPRPTLLQRLLVLLYSYADTAILSVVIFGILYFASFLAEMIGPLSVEACQDRIMRLIGSFEK